MKIQNVKIKLITLIGIILAMATILLITIIVAKNSRESEEPHQEIATNNVISNTEVQEQNTVINNTEKSIVKNTDFILKFIKQENDTKNKIYSPLSIKYCLNMLLDGANGNTYLQLKNAMNNLELPNYDINNDKISIANGAFVRDKYFQYIMPDFKESLTTKYKADIIKETFQNATNVNSWIKRKTLGLIENMLSDDQVQDENVQIIIANALAMKMKWEEKFTESSTGPETFYLTKENKKEVAMMNKEASTNRTSYYIDNDFTAVTMNLEKTDKAQFEFMAIMPHDGDLQKFVNTLSIEKINKIDKNLKKASSNEALKIKIPKFKFDYKMNLKDDLKKQGLTDAFDESKADFSRLANIKATGQNLYVSDILHKANINFTEGGIEAAAVTTAIMATKAAYSLPISYTIEFNKPFAFLIRDKDNKEIWFVGTVYEPTLWENNNTDGN